MICSIVYAHEHIKFGFLSKHLSKPGRYGISGLMHGSLSDTTSSRSGQGVTFLYLSFFEQDTTFKCLNEIFLLLF